MDVQAAQTSVTWSGRTKTPIRWANFGLVDRPPPTMRSYPATPSTFTTPTKETSSISGSVQWSTQPDIDVFHLRGRLLNSGLPTYFATVSAITPVAAITSSARTPARGQ